MGVRVRVGGHPTHLNLQSRFHVARAHGKLETVESVTRALNEYSSLDAYLRQHKATFPLS